MDDRLCRKRSGVGIAMLITNRSRKFEDWRDWMGRKCKNIVIVIQIVEKETRKYSAFLGWHGKLCSGFSDESAIHGQDLVRFRAPANVSGLTPEGAR